MGSEADSASASVRVVNRQGLHARPISEFVKIVVRHRSQVTVEGPGGQADGSSVLQMMGLVAPVGSELHIHASGSDCRDVLTALCRLVEQGFGEH